jgi:hypothetical protein
MLAINPHEIEIVEIEEKAWSPYTNAHWCVVRYNVPSGEDVTGRSVISENALRLYDFMIKNDLTKEACKELEDIVEDMQIDYANERDYDRGEG